MVVRCQHVHTTVNTSSLEHGDHRPPVSPLGVCGRRTCGKIGARVAPSASLSGSLVDSTRLVASVLYKLYSTGKSSVSQRERPRERFAMNVRMGYLLLPCHQPNHGMAVLRLIFRVPPSPCTSSLGTSMTMLYASLYQLTQELPSTRACPHQDKTSLAPTYTG